MKINLAKGENMDRKSSDRKRTTGRETKMGIAYIDPGGYVRKMVELESRGNGDECNALDRVARRIGIGSRVARRIKNGERKVDTTLFAKMHSAYLELCESQIRKLENEIATERALVGEDHDLDDIANVVASLRERLQAKKAKTQ